MPLRRIVAIAIVLRVAVAFGPPALSGDVHRYLWDGRLFRSGINPYAHAPDDPGLAHLRPAWHARINHPSIRTIYPPHAQFLFAIFPTLLLWRAFLVACDVAIVLLLRKRGDLALAYAAFPLAVFEGAWSGHVEVAAALLLLLAFRNDSGAAAGAAAGVKLIPLAALPALLARSSHRLRFAVAGALVMVLPLIPFALAGEVMPGMRDYATRWIFNSPLFDLVHAAIDRAGAADALRELWTAVKDPLRLETLSPFVYGRLYSDFLARSVLAIAAVAAIALLVVRRRSVSSSVAALLICSPAVHPWYWLVLVPLSLSEGARLWIGFALAAPFSYLLYDGVPAPVVALLCYGLPLVTAPLLPSGNVSSAVAAPSAETPPRAGHGTSRW